MRKLLTLLLVFVSLASFAQTGQYKDQWVSPPNNFNTIVYGQFKAWNLNIPHYLLTNRRHNQDSIGTIFLNTNTSDPHIYIKNLVGSTYVPLAYLSDIHANTFTNDFKLTGSLVGVADTLHRTNLYWVINNTSVNNPALVINSFNSSGSIESWNSSGTNVANMGTNGVLKGPGMQYINSPFNALIATTSLGTVISRGIADNKAALQVVNNNFASNGQLFQVQNYSQTLVNTDVFGAIIHKPISTAVSGSATGYWMLGQLKPSANGDKLVGFRVEPTFGSSTVTTTGSLVGGSGYPNGTEFANFTGGTGSNLVAQVTVSGGVITSYTITDGGINYTNGDVVSFLIVDGSGTPIGSGGTLTITGVTSYTGVSSVSAWFKNAPIQLDPISTPSVLQTGMMWQDGSHLYAYINGVIRQIDNQVGVSSIFGRNGNVLAQSGDYNTSQVTESGNLYFTQARVLATPATGFSPSAGVISATDPLITVLNKLQGNITAATTGVSTWNGRTGAVTLTTADVNAVLPTQLGAVTVGGVPYTLLTGSVPTWNQNTTGSAAKLTTTRAINGVNFDGTAAITITANTPGTHTNGYGIVGSPFSGANQTWRIDTARGKLVTTYGLLDTINAHGATAGYGINSTLFSAGTVAADSTQLASKAWAQAAFFTKNQILNSPISYTALHTYKDSTTSTTITALLALDNKFASTASTDLFSPAIRLRVNRFNITDQTSDFLIYHEANSSTTVDQLLFGYSFNGAAPTKIFSLDRFGNFNLLPTGTQFTITNGNLNLGTAGNHIIVAEGSNGYKGQTTLVSGTKAITITGLATSNRAFVSFVSIGGTVTTTWQYAGVCTSNTLTITALTTSGTTNTSDTSLINYIVY